MDANANAIPVVLESEPEDANYFTTKLGQPLILEGEWEVALQEMIAPQTWNNVTRENCHFSYYYPSKNSSKVLKEEVQAEIPEGYYETIDDVLDAMREALPEEVRGTGRKDNNALFKFDYSQQTRHVTIELKDGCTLGFKKGDLGRMLGFDETGLSKRTNVGAYPAIADHIQALYVYSDCIRPVPVGDTVAPLLLVVPITASRPRSIYVSFSNPRFIPVSKQSIDRIAIRIYSSSGKPIPFQGGNTFVKLLFRRARVF